MNSNHRLARRARPISIGLFLQCALIWSPTLSGAQHSPEAQAGPAPFPVYKPSARSPQPLDIRDNAYGASPNAPNALRIGDVVEDFSARRAGGGLVSLRDLRKHGPVAIIFYRGHW